MDSNSISEDKVKKISKDKPFFQILVCFISKKQFLNSFSIYKIHLISTINRYNLIFRYLNGQRMEFAKYSKALS